MILQILSIFLYLGSVYGLDLKADSACTLSENGCQISMLKLKQALNKFSFTEGFAVPIESDDYILLYWLKIYIDSCVI